MAHHVVLDVVKFAAEELFLCRIYLYVLEGGAPLTSPPTRQRSTVSRFVSTLKRFCNKEYGENIWERYFYDHIIRNQEDYEKHVKYVCENPARWYYEE